MSSVSRPDVTGWHRIVGYFGVDLRRGEGAVAALLFFYFFLLITFQYTSKSVRQATFIDDLGAEKLPIVYLILAVGTLPVLLLYSQMVERVRRRHLIPLSTLCVAASVVFFWWLYQFEGAWIRVAFYVWISIVYVLNVSQFWSYSNHALDPRQAKRLFGFIGAGGLLGGIAGGQVAKFASSVVDTRFALLVSAAILLAATGLMYLVQRRHGARELDSSEAAGLTKLERARGGFSAIRRSRHLAFIAGIMLLTITVANVVDLQFNWAMEKATEGLSKAERLDALTGGFGNFYAIMGLSALIFQLAFTARIHRRLGIGFAMKVLPVTLGLGTAGLLVAATAMPGAMLMVCRVLKIGENGLRYSLDQATRELLFLPVPSRARLEAKAYIDVFVQRSGKATAGLLLLPVTLGWLTVIQAGWMSLVLIVVWLALTVAARHEYVRSFRTGLRRRTMETDVPIDLSDVTALEILVESLGSADRRQVLHGLELLSYHGKGNLVTPLLLYHEDAQIRLETLKVLADVGRRDAVSQVERCVGDADPSVRAEAIRTLAELKKKNVGELMVPRLSDAAPSVRAAAVAAVANHGDEPTLKEATRALVEMVGDADFRCRVEAAKAIGGVREPVFQSQLVQLLYDSDHRVVCEAISAVRRRVGHGGFVPIYPPMLIAKLRDRRVKHESREALVTFGEPVIPVLAHFMSDPREDIWVRRAIPKTLARIGTPQALQVLVEHLGGAPDAFLRRKLIEALASVAEDNDLSAHHSRIRGVVLNETRGYLQCLADLWSLGASQRARLDGPLVVWADDEGEPNLLERLLADRMEYHLFNIFGLLAMIHPPEHINAALRGLVGSRGTMKSHALEFLENTLSKDVRRHVFAVVGDSTQEETFREARRLFDIRTGSRIDTIRRVLHAPQDEGEDTASWKAAALYEIYEGKIDALYAEVAPLRESEEPFVRETAAWVADRLDLAATGS